MTLASSAVYVKADMHPELDWLCVRPATAIGGPSLADEGAEATQYVLLIDPSQACRKFLVVQV